MAEGRPCGSSATGTAADQCELVQRRTVRGAFWNDVRPMVREWRKLRGLPEDPLAALAESGYVQRISAERGGKMAPSPPTLRIMTKSRRNGSLDRTEERTVV